MLQATIQKNDRKAYWLIGVFSIVVFALISALDKYKLSVVPGFDVHIFAAANAVINSCVAVLLIAGLVTVRQGRYRLHRNIMLAAMLLSILFLLSYIAHHLFAGEARFGDINHDGIVSDAEKLQAGILRPVYLVLLSTHILLSGLILPFILLTAYRGLTSEFVAHRKLSKYTWPVWLYVALSGPVVYLLIRPYYA